MVKKEKEVTSSKEEAFKQALALCRKELGEEAILSFDDASSHKVEFTSSGSLALDLALGGGYPRGRIIECFGQPSSGKSTLCLHAAAEVQKIGGNVVYVDMENALDPYYAEAIGVDIKKMAISQPSYGEEAIKIVEKMIPYSDLIVIDSVAALLPKSMLDGEITDNFIGTHAKLMSRSLQRLSPMAQKHNTTLIFVNQTRMKVGVMFGSPIVTTGGEALKFYASQRLDVSRTTAPIKDGEEAIGNDTKVKVIKNKVAPPFKIAEFKILYGKGISKAADILNLAVKNDIIDKAGSWFSYNGEKIGQGETRALSWLEENLEMQEEILVLTKAKMLDNTSSKETTDVKETTIEEKQGIVLNIPDDID